MGALSQNDEDDVRRTPAASTIVPPTTRSSSQHQERRKSARLNKRQDPTDVDDEISIDPHDSGTESDEEEIASITSSMSSTFYDLMGFD
ncbi:hypothetical protein B9Z55_020805 [Caenorhabditis nigoni]|nr:hypothetical protein B9Z55_020805 [Caenorhabditis nigoni]